MIAQINPPLEVGIHPHYNDPCSQAKNEKEVYDEFRSLAPYLIADLETAT